MLLVTSGGLFWIVALGPARCAIRGLAFMPLRISRRRENATRELNVPRDAREGPAGWSGGDGPPSRRKAISYRGQTIDELGDPGSVIVIGIFVSLVFLYSLVSARLERTVVTAPILFTAAGMLLLPSCAAPAPGADAEGLRLVAEVGLVLLLFTDASRTDLGVLQDIANLPARLLSIGMLLTILLGALGALVVFRGSRSGRPASWPPSSRRPTPASDRSS